MVQDQLVEYILSQMKLGVSRETIKAALIGAGWAVADVEDTFKKVEGAGKPTVIASTTPATATPSSVISTGTSPKPMSSTTPAGLSPSVAGGGAAKGVEPQTIRMSDLVSASVSAATIPAARSTKSAVQKNSPIDPTRTGGVSKSGRVIVMMIIGIIIIVVLGALAGYLYFQNNGLAAQVASLGAQSADVASRISSLNAQVQTFDASNTALTAQVASLTGENANLLTNLSFAAVPPLSSSTPASETVSVSGTLTGGKSSYALTTQYGVVVYVKNATDANVTAALKPLLNGTSTVSLVGTHVPGSPYMTVTAVNGSAIVTVNTSTTTTSSSTAP
ncbi:MAG: hypothetical protein ABSE18_00220 [Minisyncoccia bacterium]|jgi:cell division protein FtsB